MYAFLGDEAVEMAAHQDTIDIFELFEGRALH